MWLCAPENSFHNRNCLAKTLTRAQPQRVVCVTRGCESHTRPSFGLHHSCCLFATAAPIMRSMFHSCSTRTSQFAVASLGGLAHPFNTPLPILCCLRMGQNVTSLVGTALHSPKFSAIAPVISASSQSHTKRPAVTALLSCTASGGSSVIKFNKTCHIFLMRCRQRIKDGRSSSPTN